MTNKATLSNDLAKQLKGQQVTKAIAQDAGELILQFAGGAVLSVKWQDEGLHVRLTDSSQADGSGATRRPTKRQLDYLLFIQKYITRYGRAPAESDIERHFLVSAPSVNQMMQTLVRRGFITRKPGVPRSTRLCIDSTSLLT